MIAFDFKEISRQADKEYYDITTVEIYCSSRRDGNL